MDIGAVRLSGFQTSRLVPPHSGTIHQLAATMFLSHTTSRYSVLASFFSDKRTGLSCSYSSEAESDVFSLPFDHSVSSLQVADLIGCTALHTCPYHAFQEWFNGIITHE